MGKLVVHNHYKEQSKDKREQEIIRIVLKIMKQKIS
jgi:hypothetical protein